MATPIADKITEADAQIELDKRTAAVQAETRRVNARVAELNGEHSFATWSGDVGLRHAYADDFDAYADERRRIFESGSLGSERADVDFDSLAASCADVPDAALHALCESAMRTSAGLLRAFRQSADYCESVLRSKLAR